ncbi:MAG: class F sortase [Candidatus Levyibacteriota bacterium]
MKKLFLLLVFAVLGIGSAFVLQKGQAQYTRASVSSKTSVDIPTQIVIPKLDVSAPIEAVGVDKENRMDVPKNVYNTAWYKYGPKPGELGSAVIDGHFDTPTGSPSVFWNLKDLSPGDIIRVIDTKGKSYTFSVVEEAKYPVTDIPLMRIFSPNTVPMLNLITCAGVWDGASKSYTQRIVVYSRLKDSSH